MPKTNKFANTLDSADWLREEYVAKGRSCPDIAKELQCDQATVNKKLKKAGIPLRSHSENGKRQEHLGSHAPRPRKVFAETVNDDQWVLDRKHLNASEMAKQGKCSVITAQLAMERVGLVPPSISEAKAGRPSTKRIDESKKKPCRTRSSRRAHIICPEGPCTMCGQPSNQINHKSRNWQDNALDNLERVCGPCHSRQYKAENKVMYEIITKNGTDMEAFKEVFERARKMVLEGAEGHFKNKPLGSLEYKGEIKSLAQWAISKGMNPDTLRSRLQKGMPVEAALETPVKQPQVYEFQGVRANLAEHSKKVGIPYALVHGRIHSLGWTLDRALSTPIREDDPIPTLEEEILAEEEENMGTAHPLDAALANRPLKPPTKHIEPEEEEMGVEDLLDRLDDE